MTKRQLNMVQAVLDGIKLAESELSGPGDHRAQILDVIRRYFLDDDYIPFGAGVAAYLARYVTAWQAIGSPDPYNDMVP